MSAQANAQGTAFTGQYSYISDDATDLGSSGFGLMFYQSRWYDPSLGRMAQADTIVPGGVQGLDRYAYVNNSPLNYVDPSGHFGQCHDGQSGYQCRMTQTRAAKLYAKWDRDEAVRLWLQEQARNATRCENNLLCDSSGIVTNTPEEVTQDDHPGKGKGLSIHVPEGKNNDIYGCNFAEDNSFTCQFKITPEVALQIKNYIDAWTVLGVTGSSVLGILIGTIIGLVMGSVPGAAIGAFIGEVLIGLPLGAWEWITFAAFHEMLQDAAVSGTLTLSGNSSHTMFTMYGSGDTYTPTWTPFTMLFISVLVWAGSHEVVLPYAP